MLNGKTETQHSPHGGRWRGAFSSLLIFLLASITACTSDTPEYNPYYDWEARNTAWYRQIADSARRAIGAAQRQWGEEWQEHCDWRMYKSLLKSPDRQSGNLGDSICVHILSRGTGTYSPAFNDSLRISFRGWLMPTSDADGNTVETVFTQTYYGAFDAATAAPNLAAVSTYNSGVATALMYMVEGDDWMVYIPQELFYGSTTTGAVEAYSTVRMRIHVAAIYPRGTTVPTWKAPRRVR